MGAARPPARRFPCPPRNAAEAFRQTLPLCNEETTNQDGNQNRTPLQQTRQKHPDEWQQDLNPNHLAGQNIGPASDTHTTSERTAFHLRKAGMNLGNIDDEELKQVPVLAEGERLQQGATYVDLNREPRIEFTARGNMQARAGDAYVPKDRVPYETWNRLIGEEKPGQK